MVWFIYETCKYIFTFWACYYFEYGCIPGKPQPVNGFAAIGALPELVVAYGSSDCPTYQCLNATRTKFDPSTRNTGYAWHFMGLNGTRPKVSSFNIQFEDSPDQPIYTMDGDDCHVYTANMTYSDYSTCMVVMTPYFLDNLCMLWVTRSVLNNIPKNCIDAFRKNCGEDSPVFSGAQC
ncbi:uncharacterized protein LOC144163977 [Haemaphysalis longicornis]